MQPARSAVQCALTGERSRMLMRSGEYVHVAEPAGRQRSNGGFRCECRDASVSIHWCTRRYLHACASYRRCGLGARKAPAEAGVKNIKRTRCGSGGIGCVLPGDVRDVSARATNKGISRAAHDECRGRSTTVRCRGTEAGVAEVDLCAAQITGRAVIGFKSDESAVVADGGIGIATGQWRPVIGH